MSITDMRFSKISSYLSLSEHYQKKMIYLNNFAKIAKKTIQNAKRFF